MLMTFLASVGDLAALQDSGLGSKASCLGPQQHLQRAKLMLPWGLVRMSSFAETKTANSP